LKAPKNQPLPRVLVAGLAVAGVVATALVSYYVTHHVPGHNWLFSGRYAVGFKDLETRIADVLRVKAGGELYSPEDHLQYFTYPPAALFLFWVVDLGLAQFGDLPVDLGFGRGPGRHVGRGRSRGDHLGPGHLHGCGYLGRGARGHGLSAALDRAGLRQVGTMIALMIALDILSFEHRGRGALIGVATAVKLYPVVFVALALRRQWAQLLPAGVASAATVTLVAFVLWPHHSAVFFWHRLINGREITHFLHNPHWVATSSSPFTLFFRPPFSGGAVGHVLGYVALAATLALGLWSSQRLWHDDRLLAGLVVLGATSVLASPVVWDHYFTWAPLTALRRLTRTAIASCWPLRPSSTRSFSWSRGAWPAT
jgi:hypothetical protein